MENKTNVFVGKNWAFAYMLYANINGIKPNKKTCSICKDDATRCVHRVLNAVADFAKMKNFMLEETAHVYADVFADKALYMCETGFCYGDQELPLAIGTIASAPSFKPARKLLDEADWSGDSDEQPDGVTKAPPSSPRYIPPDDQVTTVATSTNSTKSPWTIELPVESSFTWIATDTSCPTVAKTTFAEQVEEFKKLSDSLGLPNLNQGFGKAKVVVAKNEYPKSRDDRDGAAMAIVVDNEIDKMRAVAPFWADDSSSSEDCDAPLSKPSAYASQPTSTKKWVLYRGKSASHSILKRLNDFYSQDNVKLVFKNAAQNRHTVSSCAAYLFQVPTYTSPIFNHDIFMNVCRDLEDILQMRDKSRNMPYLDLKPYIIVKIRRNPNVPAPDGHDYLTQGGYRPLSAPEQCRVCKRQNTQGHLCNCRSCGLPFEEGKRHDCERAKKARQQEKEDRKVLDKLREQIPPVKLPQSPAPNRALEDDVEKQKEVKEHPVCVDDVVALPFLAKLEKAKNDHVPPQADGEKKSSLPQGYVEPDQVLEDLKEIYEFEEFVDNPSANATDFSYDTPYSYLFSFKIPSGPLQLYEALKETKLCQLIFAWLLVWVSTLVEGYIYLPISRLLFSKSPSGIFETVAYYLYGPAYHWTYWSYLNGFLSLTLIIVAIYWSIFHGCRVISVYLTQDLVISRSFSFVRKLKSPQSDSRSQKDKVGKVKYSDPNIWEVKMVEKIWNASSRLSGTLNRGIFWTTRTSNLYVSLALYQNSVGLSTFNSTEDLSNVKRRLATSLQTNLSINIPSNLAVAGVMVHNDTLTYALHQLQMIRKSEDVFAST